MLGLNRLCLPACQISPFLIRLPGGGHLPPGEGRALPRQCVWKPYIPDGKNASISCSEAFLQRPGSATSVHDVWSFVSWAK